MLKIHIIEIETGLEAHAVRYAAEHWGASVSVTWVANSAQVVNFFAGCPEQEVIIISGHGNEHGLLLPKLAEEVKHKYPYNDVITPEDFAQFIQLNKNIVINTSCMSGTKVFADVFLSKGARCYIAPNNYPEGSSTLMYLLSFIYEYTQNRYDVEKAHYYSSQHPNDRQQFILFKA